MSVPVAIWNVEWYDRALWVQCNNGDCFAIRNDTVSPFIRLLNDPLGRKGGFPTKSEAEYFVQKYQDVALREMRTQNTSHSGISGIYSDVMLLCDSTDQWHAFIRIHFQSDRARDTWIVNQCTSQNKNRFYDCLLPGDIQAAISASLAPGVLLEYAPDHGLQKGHVLVLSDMKCQRGAIPEQNTTRVPSIGLIFKCISEDGAQQRHLHVCIRNSSGTVMERREIAWDESIPIRSEALHWIRAKMTQHKVMVMYSWKGNELLWPEIAQQQPSRQTCWCFAGIHPAGHSHCPVALLKGKTNGFILQSWKPLGVLHLDVYRAFRDQVSHAAQYAPHHSLWDSYPSDIACATGWFPSSTDSSMNEAEAMHHICHRFGLLQQLVARSFYNRMPLHYSLRDGHQLPTLAMFSARCQQLQLVWDRSLAQPDMTALPLRPFRPRGRDERTLPSVHRVDTESEDAFPTGKRICVEQKRKESGSEQQDIEVNNGGGGGGGGGHVEEGEALRGGLRLTPQPGKYEAVIELDFAQKYPSTIVGYGLCPTTLLCDGQTTSFPVCEIETDDGVVIRYRKRPLAESVIPFVVDELMGARRHIQERLKDLGIGSDGKRTAEEMEEEAQRLRQQETASKLVCNAVYGSLGIQHSNSLCANRVIAATITGLSRRHLEQLATLCFELFEDRVIFGQTDSVMVDVSHLPAEIRWSEAENRAKVLTMEMGHQQLVRVSAVYEPFILLPSSYRIVAYHRRAQRIHYRGLGLNSEHWPVFTRRLLHTFLVLLWQIPVSDHPPHHQYQHDRFDARTSNDWKPHAHILHDKQVLNENEWNPWMVWLVSQLAQLMSSHQDLQLICDLCFFTKVSSTHGGGGSRHSDASDFDWDDHNAYTTAASGLVKLLSVIRHKALGKGCIPIVGDRLPVLPSHISGELVMPRYTNSDGNIPFLLASHCNVLEILDKYVIRLLAPVICEVLPCSVEYFQTILQRIVSASHTTPASITKFQT